MRRLLKLLATTTLVLGLSAPWAMAGDPHSSTYLGVMVDKVSPETAASLHISGGTLISTVDSDGPACQAGLKPGDIVSAFNGSPVPGPDQFASMIHSNAPGSTVTLTIWRNGKSQDIKVKLGSWSQMARVPPPPPIAHVPLNPVGTMPPMPPVPAVPDVDIRTYTPMVARSGIIVEALSSQLAEYFGVPVNQGVLVRTVEKGGPGSAAGLKAGDVILRVNNETIHDMADWKRALKAQSGKVSLQIMRDKRQQTLQMAVPASTSELTGPDWEQFDRDMKAMAEELKTLQPEIEANAREWAQMAQLDRKQIDEIHGQAEEAAKSWTPAMKMQAEELSKQTEQMNKEIAKMAPEWQKQAKEFAETWKPTAEQWKTMQEEINKSMKDLQPELQKQMEQFQKEWKEQMQEWQKSWSESVPKRM